MGVEEKEGNGGRRKDKRRNGNHWSRGHVEREGAVRKQEAREK